MHDKRVNYLRARSWRSRRHVDGLGAQKMQQLMQEATLPHTQDLDVKNMKFAIIPQIIARLGVKDEVLWKEELDHLRELGADRSEICKRELRVSEAEGKDILLKVFEGGEIPQTLQHNSYLQRHQRVGRWWRCLATQVFMDVFDALSEDPDVKHPDRSVAAHLWMGCEDYILQVLVHYLLEFNNAHMSLHFDGVRIDQKTAEAVAEAVGRDGHTGANGDDAILLRACEKHIKAQTGYNVELKIKSHSFFQELLHQGDHESLPPLDAFYKLGNCIGLALCRLLGKDDEVLALLNSMDDASGATDVTIFKSRTYKSFVEPLHIGLHHTTGASLGEDGSYLLHCEKAGNPHCVAITVSRGSFSVMDGSKHFKMDKSKLTELILNSIDRKLVSVFRVDPTVKTPAWLLPFLAGASGSGEAVDTDAESSEAETDTHVVWEDICDDADEAVVRVHEALAELLRTEVDHEIREISKQQRGQGGSALRKRCPLCPLKAFTAQRRDKQAAAFKKHLENYHLPRDASTSDLPSYIPSGTKQLRVLMTLFENDAVSGRKRSNYLAASADIVRSFCPRRVQASTRSDRDTDKSLCFLLDDSCAGFFFNHGQFVRHDLRRVGNIYYTVNFANLFIMLALTEHGRLRTIRNKLVQEYVRRGLFNLNLRHVVIQTNQIKPDPIVSDLSNRIKPNQFKSDSTRIKSNQTRSNLIESIQVASRQVKASQSKTNHVKSNGGSSLWHLLPTHPKTWAPLLEDILASPYLCYMKESMLDTCGRHEEFTHLLMDCTVRVAMRLKGQANYRCSKATRALSVFPDGAALRRVLTVRGRTGAVLGMWLIPDETAEYCSVKLALEFPGQYRQQVICVFCDYPSSRLFFLVEGTLLGASFLMFGPGALSRCISTGAL